MGRPVVVVVAGTLVIRKGVEPPGIQRHLVLPIPYTQPLSSNIYTFMYISICNNMYIYLYTYVCICLTHVSTLLFLVVMALYISMFQISV